MIGVICKYEKTTYRISPIFKFSTTVRTVIYTTNTIESLNSTYRKLNRQRSVFPSDTALLKALYLDIWSYEEMDQYDPELGTGVWWTEYYVRRAPSRVTNKQANKTGGKPSALTKFFLSLASHFLRMPRPHAVNSPSRPLFRRGDVKWCHEQELRCRWHSSPPI